MSKISNSTKNVTVNGQQSRPQPAMSKKLVNATKNATRNKAATKAAVKTLNPLLRVDQRYFENRPIGNGKENSNTIRRSKKGAQINGLSDDGTMKMEKRLQKRSPWYASLRNPMQGAGARIPDLTGINTATFQSVQVISVTTNAQGMNGLLLQSPFPCNAGSIKNILPIAPAATPALVSWSTAAGQFLAAQGTLVAVAQSIRVVSAAIYAEYEGATLSDTGEATSFVIPYQDAASGAVITQNYNDFQKAYGSSVVPLNKARSQPLVSYYFPVSLNTWEYSDFQDLDNTEWSNKPTNGTVTYSPYWSMGHIMSGLTGTPTVKYTLVINYEFIPRYNTLDYIAASPSPIDPIEEQMVEQWIQSDAQTGLSSNKLVDVQPGAQKTDEASQGMTAGNAFGMLGSVVKEILPLLSLL